MSKLECKRLLLGCIHNVVSKKIVLRQLIELINLAL